jgi:excinuclease ABC subunit C
LKSLLETLRAAAADAPLEPGCYIMRGAESEIIYVGKAKSLRHRLGSYFGARKDIKTATLMRRVKTIETILVSNEYEALLLENTLIKRHSPKYNIDLKDGKSYPVIRITAGDFPRLVKTRHIVNDGSRYFGPYPNSQAVDKVLDAVKKIYPVRKCALLRKRAHPCVYFHIELCAAPCCGRIDSAAYGAYIEKIAAFLRGDTEPLTFELSEKMHEAARRLSFEKAAQLRDVLSALNQLGAEQSVVDFDTDSRDYIACAAEGVLSTWAVFSMRGGKLTGRELYRTKNAAADNESLEIFCMIYYTPERPPPARIFVMPQDGSFNGENLVKYFQERFGCAPEIGASAEKRHLAALAMARQNAFEDLRKRLKERGMGPALDELKRLLGLARRPERIEGFDISQLDGIHPVASLISFYNGAPDKKNYRLFKLKTVIGKVDDFAAMREAVYRRYSRLLREGRELPDLILVDGGIGQVNAAKSALDALGIVTGLAGLAKRDEEIWLPAPEGASAAPLSLPKSAEPLKILQAVRDETHRFATSLNQKLRSKDLALTTLESIDGIGAARARRLIQRFRSLRALADAPVEEIAQSAGISAALSKLVRAAVRLELENRRPPAIPRYDF